MGNRQYNLILSIPNIKESERIDVKSVLRNRYRNANKRFKENLSEEEIVFINMTRDVVFYQDKHTPNCQMDFFSCLQAFIKKWTD